MEPITTSELGPMATFVEEGGAFVGTLRTLPTMAGGSVKEKAPSSTWPARWRTKLVSVSAVTVRLYQPLLLVGMEKSQLVELAGGRIKPHVEPGLRLSVTVKLTGLVSGLKSPKVMPSAAGLICEVIST